MGEQVNKKTEILLRLAAIGVKETDLSYICENFFESQTGGGEQEDRPFPYTIQDPLQLTKELRSFYETEFFTKSEQQQQQEGSKTLSNFQNTEATTRLSEETIKMLDAWSNFDIFGFAEKAGQSPGCLVKMGELLFERHSFRDKYRISRATLRGFLYNLQGNYNRDLPYHNEIHAADVAQSMSHFITCCGLGQKGDDLLRFASIVAALGHDVGHPGYTNRYLIETRSQIALTYNDKSPLENMHASCLFSVLYSPRCNISSSLKSQDVSNRFRKLVIELILATDNAHHNEILNKISSSNSKKCEEDDIYKAALHAADLGGGGKTTLLAKNWAERVLTEFYRQGDSERQLGISVIPVMDRNSSMPRGVFQESFIRTICLPLYKQLNEIPGLDFSVPIQCFESNARYWVGDTTDQPKKSLRAIRSFTNGNLTQQEMARNAAKIKKSISCGGGENDTGGISSRESIRNRLNLSPRFFSEGTDDATGDTLLRPSQLVISAATRARIREREEANKKKNVTREESAAVDHTSSRNRKLPPKSNEKPS